MKKWALVLSLVVCGLAACGDEQKDPSSAAGASNGTNGVSKPALTVTQVQPVQVDWPLVLTAGGNIAAWQEAVIGPELANYRIAEVLVSVGDTVKAGQVMARIAADGVAAEQAEMRANLAEANAAMEEARMSHERARQLREKGFYSAQQATQAQAALATAEARVAAAAARVENASLRRTKTVITAPDAGIVSARTATAGATVQPGQELFRLIRQGRLEWRAEVAAADLSRLQAGNSVSLALPGGSTLAGRVRVLAPTVDPRTHTALVYVDLPANAAQSASAGMYARGQFKLGNQPALTLPQSAVLLREAYAYVFRIEGGKVVQTKVTTGRRMDERIEIFGIAPDAKVVESGVAFLADGDTVKIVDSVAGNGAKAAQ